MATNLGDLGITVSVDEESIKRAFREGAREAGGASGGGGGGSGGDIPSTGTTPGTPSHSTPRVQPNRDQQKAVKKAGKDASKLVKEGGITTEAITGSLLGSTLSKTTLKGAASSLLSKVGGTAAAAGPAGLAAGLVIGAAVLGLKTYTTILKKTTATVRMLDNLLMTTSRRLSAVNGVLAAAEARSTVRGIQRDIISGATLSGPLSRFRSARDDVLDAIRPIKDLVTGAIASHMTTLFRLIKYWVDGATLVARLLATIPLMLMEMISRIADTFSVFIPNSPLKDILDSVHSLRDSARDFVFGSRQKNALDSINSSNTIFMRDLEFASGVKLFGVKQVFNPVKP